MEQEKYEIVKFVDNGFELEVNVSPSEETVWLKAEEMAMLFNVDRTSILRHANNIIQTGEVAQSTCAVFAQVQNEGGRLVIDSFKSQCGELTVRHSKRFHDRFLILDNTELYNCGASLKDAGKKVFALNRMHDPEFIEGILARI